MAAVGFSLNNLSLFGLVLAIGIVVDDAIVVVENVERNIALGLVAAGGDGQGDGRSQRRGDGGGAGAVRGVYSDGVHRGHLRAILPAIRADHRVFDADFRVQLADAQPGALRHFVAAARRAARSVQPGHGSDGWLVFQRVQPEFLARRPTATAARFAGLIRVSAVVLLIYVGLIALTWFGFRKVPTGFIPPQDKGYLVIAVQLPDSASLERTDAIVDRISKIVSETPGVKASIDLAGLSPISLSASPNSGTVFVILDDFQKRTPLGLTGDVIANELRQAAGGHSGGICRRVLAAAGQRHGRRRRIQNGTAGPRRRWVAGVAGARPSN